MTFRFEKPLHFDRRHAARARRRDRLAVGAVLHVARVEHAGDIGPRAALREDVAVGIEFDLPDERLGVGNVADGDEESVDVRAPTSRRSRRSRSFTPVTSLARRRRSLPPRYW